MGSLFENLGAYFEAGGFVMPALLGLSVFLWALIVERWLYLFGPFRFFRGWRSSRGDRELHRLEISVRRFLSDRSSDAARALHGMCADADDEMARFIHRGLLERDVSDCQDLALSLDEAFAASARQIQKRIGLISVLSSLAPMLGLLGTVSGMIEAFETMTLAGGADAKALSGGISAALITTQVGLVIALPGLFSRSLFRRRARKLLDNLDLLVMRIRGMAPAEGASSLEESETC
jgi:biopolymer transport protein ExbB